MGSSTRILRESCIISAAKRIYKIGQDLTISDRFFDAPIFWDTMHHYVYAHAHK